MRNLASPHVLVFGLALAATSPALSSPALAAGALKSGDKAPAFALKAVDTGEVRSLETLGKGKAGTAVVFVSSKCPWVKEARAPLADLVKRFGSKIAFVGLNANHTETADEIKADASTSFQFPVLLDPAAKTADAYGAERTPEIFVVDPQGVIRYHGGIADLGAALDDVVAGKPVRKADSKSLGCTIKRAK